MQDELKDKLKSRKTFLTRKKFSYGYHKRSWFIETIWRWPWKLESYHQCVTTDRSNELALKMEGAKKEKWMDAYTYPRRQQKKK